MGNMFNSISFMFAFLFLNLVLLSHAQLIPREYDFYIYDINLTRMCENTTTLTINGMFPGPTLHVNKGETIRVNVHNNGTYGITIHWHGILQPRNPWSDGPLYVTQCPIQAGYNYTYELIFSREEGTIWYHAHSEWSMATVHGAIVIDPPMGRYPYGIPDGNQTIILGSWYIQEVMKMYEDAKADNYNFPNANGTTINGQPGYPNDCSALSSFKMTVESKKTYLLQIVNAVLNEDQFFGIAGHKMTLVGHDGAYTKALTSEYIRIAPGQTMDVLVTANQNAGCYYMASAPYYDGGGAFTDSTASAVLEYSTLNCSNITDRRAIPYPQFPARNNITAALNFTNSIRSLDSDDHPAVVPTNITKNVFIRVGIGALGGRTVATLNSISFAFPNISILEAYSRNLSGYYDEDFPSKIEDIPTAAEFGTKALMFNYSDAVQIVFQGGGGTHPLHIHGFTFYAVATGDGDWQDVSETITTCSDTSDASEPCYNLVDPPELNTVSIPRLGWVAVRFVADNPGVWFVHCHYEKHLTWGMSTVFIVRNGTNPEEQMIAPPDDMPSCSDETSPTSFSAAALKLVQSYFMSFASI
ncbi:laccase 14 [Euphorbia peplus]|nr:laccase 14 [Euphorbia peplus]